MAITAQQIFDKCESVGEVITGKLHVILHEQDWDKCVFRVYHSDGYCFDVTRELNSVEDTEESESYCYSFYSEWDEFSPCDENKAMELLNTK